MEKRGKRRRLSRAKDQKKALLKSLAASLLLKGKIKTTEAKAKELRIFIEKQISRTKRGGPLVKRLPTQFFTEERVIKKLTEEIAPRYKERPGGYTRIIKLGQRKSDGARMAFIEFVK